MAEGKVLPTSLGKVATKKDAILRCHINSPQMTAYEIAEKLKTTRNYVWKVLSEARKQSKVERGRSGRLFGHGKIVLRKDGFFHTGEAIIHRSYDSFYGFPYKRVPAVRKYSGWGVALVLRSSQVDADFGAQTLFLEEQHLRIIEETFRKSDELTHDLLGRGWNGVRPFWKLEDFM